MSPKEPNYAIKPRSYTDSALMFLARRSAQGLRDRRAPPVSLPEEPLWNEEEEEDV